MSKLTIWVITALVLVTGFSLIERELKAQTAAEPASPAITKMRNMVADADLPKTVMREKIVLGLGCFWGAEKRFEAMPGVINVISGYADGRGFEPTYRNITKAVHRFNPDNYAEVIQVEFNPQLISVETLLRAFYEMHNPTQKNGQGNDIGTQYRSTILTTNEAQKDIAYQLTALYQKALTENGYGPITTSIKPLENFTAAEEYHQDYIAKNPNGYCPDHSTGVKFDGTQTKIADLDNSSILEGKHIVIIDAPDCPYCEKFKADVANEYSGSVPMHFRRSEQLTGLTVTSLLGRPLHSCLCKMVRKSMAFRVMSAQSSFIDYSGHSN